MVSVRAYMVSIVLCMLFVYAGIAVVMYGLLEMNVPGIDMEISTAVSCVMIFI